MTKLVIFLFLFIFLACSDLDINKIDCSNGEACPENSTCIEDVCSLEKKPKEETNYICLYENCDYKVIKWKEDNNASNQSGNSIIVDEEGNVYILGFTDGDFDSEEAKGERDIFITKFDTYNIIKWTKIYGTEYNDNASSMKLAKDGMLYVSGNTRGQLGTAANKGESDFFLLKVNSGNGEILWHYQWGGEGRETGGFLDFDEFGNVYVLGTTDKLWIKNIFNGVSDIILTKFKKDGKLEFSKSFGSSREDRATSIFISNSSLLLLGVTRGNIEDDEVKLSLDNDIFLAKLDLDGKTIWKKQFFEKNEQYSTSIEVDNNEIIYIVGNTNDSFDENDHNGKFDSLVIKLAANSDIIWSKQWGNIEDDFVYSVNLFMDNIYLVGPIKESLVNNELTQENNFFIQKFNSNGRAQINLKFGTNKSDTPKSSFYKDGFLYITGETLGEFYNEASEDKFKDVFFLKVKVD